MPDEIIDAITRDIRLMAIAGGDVPSLLRRIQEIMGCRDCKMASILCFRKAFGAGIRFVSPVAGWSGFGGELSDEQVNESVLPVLEEYRAKMQK